MNKVDEKIEVGIKEVSDIECDLLVAIKRNIKHGKGVITTSAVVKKMIKNLDGFNVREKYAMYKASLKTIRLAVLKGKEWSGPNNTQYRDFHGKISNACEHRNARNRTETVQDELRAGRTLQGMYGIFFLCSSHNMPAPDHKDFQGKVYIDRFWRKTVGFNARLITAIEKYISDYSIRTVQDICDAPVYMITRPHCKHFFIPLATNEVLDYSPNEVRKKHPESFTDERKGDSRRKFYKMRKRAHKRLKQDTVQDDKLIKKRSGN